MGASTHTTVRRFSFLFSGLDWLNLDFFGGEGGGSKEIILNQFRGFGVS